MAIEFIRNLITSGYNVAKINDNFQKIQTALLDGLSRTGQTPNQMNADIDMNNNDILNVHSLDVTNFIWEGADFEDLIGQAAASAAASAASATASAGSATSSANSATASATSATNSATFATNSANSASAAATSAANAAANVPVAIHAAPTKSPVDDADELGFWDNISGVLRKVTMLSFLTQARSSGAQLQGYISGMTIANSGVDAVNDIVFSAGSASAAVSPFTLMTGSTLTKQLDAGWAVGNNAGGLDTGSIANGTYHCYAIRRPDTGVVDYCFSASASAPTFGGNIPVAYTQYRRVGSILREAAAIVIFTQVGDYFARVGAADISASNPGTAAVTRTLSVPTGIIITARVSARGADSTASSTWSGYITPLAITDVLSGQAFVVGNNAGSNSSDAVVMDVATNTSGQIRSRLSFSDADVTLQIHTLGWTDTRGK